MLTVAPNGSIQLSISHLLEEPPTTFAGVLERYRNLKARLFHHVISSPDCRYERNHGSGRVPAAVLRMAPEDRLKQILRDRNILGNPKGYFVTKHHPSLTPADLQDIKSVSFAFCDSEDVTKHFDARGSEFGICFFHDFLEASGMRPVAYLGDMRNIDERRQAVFNAPYLLEVQYPGYDMRWENEWRVKGQLEFTTDDVAFVIVPDDAYAAWVDWLGDNDPDILAVPSSLFRDPLDYLRMLPKLEYQSWDQIELFGSLLMNFDEFQPYAENDRIQMQARAGEIVACLAKAEIQQLYEERYVKRHQAFIKQLREANEGSGMAGLMRKLSRVDKNAMEPWHSSIDLAKAAYAELLKIQDDRITLGWSPDLGDPGSEPA